MKRSLLIALSLSLLALAADTAQAANAPDTRLDVLASQVAGHSVSVYCEGDDAEWASLVAWSHGAGTDPLTIAAFQFAGQATIWLSPRECLTLRSYLHDPTPAEARTSRGEALLALLFESERQKYADGGAGREQALGCDALAAIPTYAPGLFGYPAKVTVVRRVVRHKRVRVHGKVVRRRYVVCVKRRIPNPQTALIVKEAIAARTATRGSEAPTGSCQ